MNITQRDRDLGTAYALKPSASRTELTAVGRGTPMGELRENFPIVARAFLQSKKIPLYERARLSFKLFEGHLSWATSGFILSIIGWLPVIFARNEFAASVVYYNVPAIANTIFSLGFFAVCISIVLSLSLLPKTKMRYDWLLKLGHALEWLLVPLILVLFSALPALDAQTRLMLGRYLEFWVTDKKRTPLILKQGSRLGR